MFVVKDKYSFHASLSYRGPHFGLLDDISKVAYGNKTFFEEFQKTFWLALPSWFRKLSIASVGRSIVDYNRISFS